jgi:hypothetical protein
MEEVQQRFWNLALPAVLPTLRAAVAELDPNLPLSGITTLEEMVGRSVGNQRFVMVLVSLFAALA